MPLVRFELKNEYGLGDSRLYKGGRKEEDPRNILGGFTVSGLVGILRQLGDLAEFAAVVFHNVHQQVITTAERGQKVLNRIQKIEGALPQFEKAVQEQKSHIHFAYIEGCDWHANIQTGPSELFASDLPEFMMDSYERCRDPPRLDLLDKFDTAGSGACLKRYSDPTYLRKVMAGSESVIAGRAKIGVNIQKKKKHKTRTRNGLGRHSVHMTLHGTRNAQFAPVMTEKLRFSIDDASISDTLLNSGSRNELTLFSSDKSSGFLQPHNTPLSMSKELYDDDLSAIEEENKKNVDCSFGDYSRISASDYVIEDLMHVQYPLLSTSVSSDEKTEMVKTVNQMIPLVIPEDGLNNQNAAEYSSALSNKSRGTDGLRMQMNLVSESISDETATETGGKSDSSANSATYDENGTTDSTSPKSPDDVSAFRSSDLTVEQISELTSRLYKDMNETNALGSKVQTNVEYETGQEVILSPHLNYDVIKSVVSMSLENSTQPTPSLDGVVGDISPFSSQDSDFLLTRESLIHSDMIDNEMHKEEIDFSNTMVEISELTSQLDKHMDATNALESKVKTKLEYQIRHGVILLPHQDYYGIESEVSKIVGVDSPCKDDVGSGICPFEPQDDSDLLFLTLEPSNCHYEITGTEMPNQEDYLTLKTLRSLDGREIRELRSQSEKHLNASNAFVSEVQIDVDYQNGGAILFTNKKYDGMECDINKNPEIATTSIDDVDGEISYDSITPLNKELSPIDIDHMQPACSAEFAHLHCSVDNAVSKCRSSGSLVENGSETIGNVIPCEKINGIPQELSSSQDSFGDTSAKTASQKEILYEHETKLEVESAADSDCQLIEYQISMENVIATSKFIGPDIDSHGVCCSSSDDYASILSGTITSNTADITNSSILTDDATSSRCPNLASSPRNISEYSNGYMSTPLTDTSIILSSNVSAARTVAFQGFPVESLRKSSTNIWTNGGLLGLEPSKPPDINVPNAYCSDKIYSDRSSSDSQPCVSGNRNESRTSPFQANKLNHVVSSPEKDKFAGSNNEPESNLSKLNNDEIKVDFSGPAHRSPVNNLHRKSSIAGISPLCELMNKDVYNLDGTSILSKHNQSPKVHELQNEDVDDDVHGFSEKLVSSSLFHSGCQSPPVEHMKVSSQQMNNSVVSKLRLEFCNINLERNMGEVMFPSFQLISESFHPLESDDDTFCRSCPYSSDDLLALYSESDAETWAEDELDVSNRSEMIGSIQSSINGETNASR